MLTPMSSKPLTTSKAPEAHRALVLALHGRLRLNLKRLLTVVGGSLVGEGGLMAGSAVILNWTLEVSFSSFNDSSFVSWVLIDFPFRSFYSFCLGRNLTSLVVGVFFCFNFLSTAYFLPTNGILRTYFLFWIYLWILTSAFLTLSLVILDDELDRMLGEIFIIFPSSFEIPPWPSFCP